MAKSVRIYGRRFAALRERRHYSQEELARALHASRGTIANYEGRHIATMMPRLFRLTAELFGMGTDELLREIGVPANAPLTTSLGMPFQPIAADDLQAVSDSAPARTVPAFGRVSATTRQDFQQGHDVGRAPAPPAHSSHPATLNNPTASAPAIAADRKGAEADDGGPSSAGSPPADLFCVTAYGQCLSPVVEDGDQVYVSRRLWQREGFVSGKIYLIHLASGESTLKMAYPQGASVVLSPLENGSDEPAHRPFRVPRDQVAWAARLQWVKKI